MKGRLGARLNRLRLNAGTRSMSGILRIGRLRAFRLGAVTPDVKRKRSYRLVATLNGAPVRIRRDSLTVHDALNEEPNTCALVIDPATPPVIGDRLRLELGLEAPARVLFVGALTTVTDTYEAKRRRVFHCTAIDDTPLADRRLPFGSWTNVSATTIAQELVATYLPGFSSSGVQTGLSLVSVNLDGSEGINGALRQIVKLIGGYFYFENKILHLFTDEGGEVPDAIDTTPGRLLNEPAIQVARDDSQIRTRVYGKGHGEPSIMDVAAGASIIPIQDAVMFNPLGGRAIAETQQLAYTGRQVSNGGALVGPGIAPTAAPTATAASGTGIETGAHGYAYTWLTGTGETRPSPVVSTSTGPLASPTVAPTFLGHGGPIGNIVAGDPWASGTWSPGDTVEIGYSYGITQNLTTFTPMSPTISVVAVLGSGYFHTPNDTAKSLYIRIPFSSDPRVGYVSVWHRVNGGPWRWWQPNINYLPPLYGGYIDRNLSDPSIYSASGATPPTAALAFNQIALDGIAVGPAAVTSRRLYRTAANSSGPLKLVATIANNTATTYTDTMADAALGAVAPAGDTSGLPVPAGNVNPGDTSMIVASTAFASPTGGYVVIGNGQQVIRYTGISGNSLTGIPASGFGAIVAPVNYNSTVTGTDALTGVTGLVRPLLKGVTINIWIQRDDLQARAALAARDGSDGIIEHLITDERRGEASLAALCDADLQLFSRAAVTVRYDCRDVKTRSGKPVRVQLPLLEIDTSLRIQSVEISEIDAAPGVAPRYSVTASSVRMTLEDMLRRLGGLLEGQ